MSDEDHAELVTAATASRENARAPHSSFKVGAALRTRSGRIYAGCNVENATLGLTVCAERVALWKALSEGADGFSAVAVVTAAPRPTPPCGACRQLLWEYCGDIPVHMETTDGKSEDTTLGALFPHAFDKSDLP